MSSFRAIAAVVGYDFKMWKKNPRIIATFVLSFILCYLMSNKVVSFAEEHNTPLQAVEAFIWTFGDSSSILLSSMMLVLLFADMPFLSAGTAFYLVRTT
ncbi:MAG: hypothetical protein IIT65_15970, partial [Lachnospiraceae bacterium]|nr:hypothetical protein [Lachnospiraceae bacterium]